MDKGHYFDSCLWIPFFIPDDEDNEDNPEKELVRQQMIRIFKNRDIIIVSTLVLLEVIDRVRQMVIESHKADEIDTNSQEIINESNKRVNYVLAIISELEKKGRLLIVDSTKTLQNQNYEIYNYTYNHFGKLKRGKTIDGEIYCAYSGAHHLDFNHALNACEFNAEELITFDGGFRQIRDKLSAEFAPVRMRILYAR